MPSFSTLWLLNAAAELDAPAVVDEGRDAAQDVPAPSPHRVLDADHLRAERGERARRARARELPGEVADADVRERGRRHDGFETVEHVLDDAPGASCDAAVVVAQRCSRGSRT